MNTASEENMCRTCLGQNRSFGSVFKIVEGLDVGVTFAEVIHNHISSLVYITPNDGFPDKICSNCSEIVLNFYKFKINIEKNNLKLKSGNLSENVDYQESFTMRVEKSGDISDIMPIKKEEPEDNFQEIRAIPSNKCNEFDNIVSEEELELKLKQLHHEEDIDNQEEEKYNVPSSKRGIISNASTSRDGYYQEKSTSTKGNSQEENSFKDKLRVRKVSDSKRKCHELSLSKKVRVINEVDKGVKKKKEIAADFGIRPCTLSNIIRKRERILAIAENDVSNKRKRVKTCIYEDIDKAVLEWLKIVNDKNDIISGHVIREKALLFAKSLGYATFMGSEGWLHKFLKRHNIMLKHNSNFGIKNIKEM